MGSALNSTPVKGYTKYQLELQTMGFRVAEKLC
jgi:hypothetical protein